jgi:hypothetical protein
MSMDPYQVTGIQLTPNLKHCIILLPTHVQCEGHLKFLCTMFGAIIMSASVLSVVIIMMLLFLSIDTLARLHGEGTVYTI